MSPAELEQVGVGLVEGLLVVLVGGELEHHADVLEPAAQRRDPLEVGPDVRHAAGDLLRPLLVVPQLGVGGLLPPARRGPRRILGRSRTASMLVSVVSSALERRHSGRRAHSEGSRS